MFLMHIHRILTKQIWAWSSNHRYHGYHRTLKCPYAFSKAISPVHSTKKSTPFCLIPASFKIFPNQKKMISFKILSIKKRKYYVHEYFSHNKIKFYEWLNLQPIGDWLHKVHNTLLHCYGIKRANMLKGLIILW